MAATTIYIDVAASLEACFEDVIIPAYAEVQPNVTIVANYGSSGRLLQGIEEANAVDHDIFFSAGKAQVRTVRSALGIVEAIERRGEADQGGEVRERGTGVAREGDAEVVGVTRPVRRVA